METSTAPATDAPTTPARGVFVWYDLLTPDPAAAQGFYTRVAGWGTQSWDAPPDEPGATPYTMWTAGDTPIGGVASAPPDVPAHWLAYVGVPDLDATVAEVEAAGGTVLQPPQDIPTVGRFAVCRDPQGALFAAFEPTPGQPAPPAAAPAPGHVSWHELTTSDLDGAWAFYRRLFGWNDAGANDMGPEFGTYQLFDAGQHPLGGMFRAPAGQAAPPAWKLYVQTDGLDAAVARVREAGGRVLMEPHEVPGGDRVAICADPQGAEFGLHEPAAR